MTPNGHLSSLIYRSISNISCLNNNLSFVSTSTAVNDVDSDDKVENAFTDDNCDDKDDDNNAGNVDTVVEHHDTDIGRGNNTVAGLLCDTLWSSRHLTP